MAEDRDDQFSNERKQDILSLEYAVQLIILLAVGLLAFSFL